MTGEHPWKALVSTKERIAAASEMKEWLKANPSLRIKRGTVREDGLVFYAYSDSCAGGESWISKETRSLYKQRHLAYYKKVKECSVRGPKLAQQRLEWNRRAYARNTKNPDWRKAVNKLTSAFRKRHPDRVNALSSRRRGRERKAIHPTCDREAEQYVYGEAIRLTRETGVEFQVDHIIPLSRGGFHHQDNLQLLPWWMNNQKNNNPFWRSRDAAFRDWRDVPPELWPDRLRCEYGKQMRREPEYLLTG